MPNTPLPRQPNDLAVKAVPPANPTQRRVPTAEAATLDAEIALHLARRSRREIGWLNAPAVTVTTPRTLNLGGGVALLPIAPGYQVSLTASLQIPALSSSTEIVNRNEELSLVGFSCEVGAEQDPALGEVRFDAINPSTQAVTEQVGENTRRYRFYWVLVLSPSPLVASDFYNALPLLTSSTTYPVPSDLESARRLQVTNTDGVGFALGNYRIYALDPNWRLNTRYLVQPDLIDVLPIARVRRLQNFADRGYTWGNGGEEPLDPRYTVSVIGRLVDNDPASQVRQRLFDLLSGRPSAGSTYARAVQNFNAGAVIGNTGRVGEAASSPNNSVCLPSPNRVSYTNEAYTETLAAAKVTAGNDGNGNALLTIALENTPTGTRFSEIAANHKIYSLTGEEIGSFGRYQNLGGLGALTWIADANQKLLPGQVAYFCPAVNFPAGSGLSIPFEAVEQVWVGSTGVALDPANIRDGRKDDLAAYAAPAASQDYFVIFGPERAAIHAIYKRVEVTSNGSGVVTIPDGEQGDFVFINGVNGRIDRPVVSGLSPNTTYQALVYYPPRQIESWQFQLRFAPYAAVEPVAALSWLNGARVIGSAMAIAHTQGGGGSIFQSGGELQFSPIAMHLPIANGTTPYYALNALAQFEGEAGQGYVTFRETDFLPAPDRALPTPGQVLTAEAATTNQPRSIRGRLKVGDRPLGVRLPRLDGNKPYQAVVAFVAEKAGVRRLVIAARTGPGGVAMTFDSDTGCGLGLFDL